MAIAACVRVSRLVTKGAVDNTWGFFWQQAEASVAITMLSLTAFRSIFSSERFSTRQRSHKPWHGSKVERIRGGKGRISEDKDGLGSLPAIPSPTLTGMRTVIQDAGGTTASDPQVGDECSDLNIVTSPSAALVV